MFNDPYDLVKMHCPWCHLTYYGFRGSNHARCPVFGGEPALPFIKEEDKKDATNEEDDKKRK